jgi:hypothetical protein
MKNGGDGEVFQDCYLSFEGSGGSCQSRELSIRYSNTRHEALCKNNVAILHEIFQSVVAMEQCGNWASGSKKRWQTRSRRRGRREEAMLEEMTWVSIARLEIECNLNNNALAPGLLHCYRPSAPIAKQRWERLDLPLSEVDTSGPS